MRDIVGSVEKCTRQTFYLRVFLWMRSEQKQQEPTAWARFDLYYDN